jgi:hypothetical protein
MMFRLYAVLGVVALLLPSPNGQESCFAQKEDTGQAKGDERGATTERDSNGLFKLETARLTLISDIPLDEELRSWPGLLDQSLEQWQAYFGVDAARMDNWKVKTLLMKDRERFARLGLLDGVPAFDEGYQFGNVTYLREQPTVYYRRLLFLHEATHWMVWKLYGGGGAPWFMEGMAEMQGTHALTDGALKLGVIPASRDQVAGWGRLRLIDDTLKRDVAPTLSEILAYGNAREDHETRYSWSWAACVFFSHHPKYGPILRELYSTNKLDYSHALSVNFKKRLEPEWAEVLIEWNAFVSDLDFGYDYARSTLAGTAQPVVTPLRPGNPTRLTLATDRGWQSTGVAVELGQSIRIACAGSYQLRASESAEANWVVEPCGITYQYYRGNPVGCVIASIVPAGNTECTSRWDSVRIGSGTVVPAPKAGRLFLKINEPSNGLRDNVGVLSVEISATKP